MSLNVITGPMFAGKTEELQRVLRRYLVANREVKLYKPKLDDRYSTTKVVSHDGRELEAVPVADGRDLSNKLGQAERSNLDVVGIDEAQFLSGDLHDWLPSVRWLSDKGVDVFVALLDMDFRGHPFEDKWGDTMSDLFAVAHTVTKLTAVCTQVVGDGHYCGAPAVYTQRLQDGQPVTDGEIIQVGGAESYEPRCPSHFKREGY